MIVGASPKLSLHIFHLPRLIAVRANEGDAYPLGALQIGTRVHCVEMNPGIGAHVIRAAGTYGTILRKFDGYVVVQGPERREIAYKKECMATVGKDRIADFPYENPF